MTCKTVITIGRQFGSGGRTIGKALAERLGIKYYDKELISIAAKESGIAPEIFENVDERATNSLLYSLSMGVYSFNTGYTPIRDMPVNDKLYLLQHKIIKQIAEEPCVIVGRCADYVLRDMPNCISVFFHASEEYRKKVAIEQHGVPEDQADAAIHKTDKTRANYYSFYADQKWGMAENYDLCLDTGKITVKQAVDVIADFVRIKEEG